MLSTDFMYDGQYLSDYGFIIAQITTSDTKTVINEGSVITFEKASSNFGKKYSLLSAKYDGVYTTTFDICKNPDLNDDFEITSDEFRDLMRWLNRREYLQFCFIPDKGEETEKYYDAFFNVEKIIVKDYLIGLHLTVETNSAMGYGQEQSIKYTVSDTSAIFSLADMSDDIGYTYPDVTIEILRSGDLSIYNHTWQENTSIKNCVLGETITMHGNTMIIETDDENHQKTLGKDFNCQFVKIGNTIKNRYNKLSFSLPCRVTIKYKPNIK